MAKKEYIECETLKNEISLLTVSVSGKQIFSDEAKSSVLKIIDEQPTADVQEVRHGKWIPTHYERGIFDGCNFDKCSVCGYERVIEDLKYKTIYKFCPECGAKMDKE